MITSGTVDSNRHEPMSYETGNSADGLFLKIHTSKHERTKYEESARSETITNFV